MRTADIPECVTCGDAGTPMRILARNGSVALCESRGARTEVHLDFVPEVQPGDLILAHGGVALAKIEELA